MVERRTALYKILRFQSVSEVVVTSYFIIYTVIMQLYYVIMLQAMLTFN